MAGAFITPVGDDSPKDYPGKLTWYVVVTCIVAAMGGLIFGYDIGISGGVTSMAPFLEKFFPSVYRKEELDQSTNQYCKFNNQTLTMFTSSLYLAALFASFLASTMTKKLGRKFSMLMGGCVFCCGALLNAFAIHLAMLVIGRILLGVGVGFATQSVPLFVSEMAPHRYRGTLHVCFQLFITIGILIAGLVNYFTNMIKGDLGWRISLGGAAVPVRMYMENHPSHGVMISHTMITGGVNVLATFISVFGTDRWGRKPLFLWGGGTMIVFQSAVAVLIGTKFGVTGDATDLGTLYSSILVCCICIFVTAFAFSWGPLGWLVPSEIFPLEIRSSAQSIVVAVNMSFTFLVAQLFIAALCMVKYGLFIIFAGLVLIMSLFVIFFVPETNNIPIEEMSQVWRGHWYWKKFVDDEKEIEMKNGMP
ncbi:unnamed protein product [Camellia sinensis]